MVPNDAQRGTKLPGFYLISEAAHELKCSAWSVRQLIKNGDLRARRIGRLVRILDSDLADFMRGGDSGGAS